MNNYLRQLIPAVVLFAYSVTGYSQLHINEWMASNQSFLADNAGEFDDWIEIYNSGPTALDLGGFYLTDDPTELTKWQIPNVGAEVTCAAGSYLLFWADGDTDQGANHADFKLSADGESILLVGSDGLTIIDQVTYTQVASDIAFGRFPDGSSNIILLPSPTPESANVAGGDVLIELNLEIPITNANDDGGQFANITINKPQLHLGFDFTTPYLTGIRFPNIGLAPNAIIEEAYIQFTSFGDFSMPANYVISASSENNAAQMQLNDQNDLSGRSRLSTTVNWDNVPAWALGEKGEAQKSADISAVVQEWIQQSGWQTGGALMVLIDGDAQRDATAFEGGGSADAPKLFIKAKVPLSNTLITGLTINEIAASGTDHVDASGKYEDWAELYNTNANDVSLTGLFLTDTKDDLGKWAFPTGQKVAGGEYKVYWTDNDEEEGADHTSFNLKGKNDWLGLVQLTNTGYHIIDSIGWTDIPFQGVLGRRPDATGAFQLLGDISPAASNNSARLFLYPPSMTIAPGMYSSGQNVGLTHPESGVVFRYTLDGSLPTTTSTQYTSAINIGSSTSLRAIATKIGYAPSINGIASYIIGENVNTPVLNITTDPDNFFDDEIGIYVVGTNGIANQNCAPFAVNWAQDWERPANLQLFMPDGSTAFSADCGVKISGACSRNQPMKSLAISTREQQYGTEKFAHALFPQRDGNDYFRLKVRNSGQDYYRIGFRDMMNHNFMLGKIDVELQAGLTTLMFLNGEYWGIHNIREKFAGEYFERIYGVKEKNVSVVKSPGQPWMDIKQGSAADYMSLFDFMQTADMNSSADYEEFTNEIDLNSFISYWVVMSYLANYDWPENNVAIWRHDKPGKKWKYCVTDTDGSTYNELWFEARPDFDILAKISDPSSDEWGIHENATLFLRKLWERTEFNNEFAQRACSVMDIIFPQSITNGRIDSIANVFSPNVQRQIDRWFDAEPDKKPMGGGMAEWEIFVGLYKQFFQERPDFFRSFLKSKFGLEDTYSLTFNYDANTTGSVYVNWNEMAVPFDHVGEYFKGIPLRVKAVADPGYEFVEWLETGQTDREIEYISAGNAQLTPIFEEIDCTAGEACDDFDDCTIDDVFDADCVCKGTFQDSDGDGTCDAEDLCEGFDDNADADGDGIPDGCDEVSTYEAELAKQLLLFPNPASDQLFLENKTGLQIEQMRLVDLTGKSLRYYDESRSMISVIELPVGVYGLNLEMENGVRLFKKVVITR